MLSCLSTGGNWNVACRSASSVCARLRILVLSGVIAISEIFQFHRFCLRKGPVSSIFVACEEKVKTEQQTTKIHSSLYIYFPIKVLKARSFFVQNFICGQRSRVHSNRNLAQILSLIEITTCLLRNLLLRPGDNKDRTWSDITLGSTNSIRDAINACVPAR